MPDPPKLPPKFEKLKQTYWARVHKPSRFRVYAHTGVGTLGFHLGHDAFTLNRLERKLIRLASRESRKMRQRRVTVEFSVWPSYPGEEPYRIVELYEGEIVKDNRRDPEWTLR